MMGKIRKFWHMPWQQKCMLAEAMILSGWYRFCILHRPFSSLTKRMGEAGLETERENGISQVARQAAWIVPAVCRHMPWESKCLVQALTARKMLTRRGISCTLYMGACRNEQDQMQAHAWLRSGNIYVVGGNGSGEYAVTSVYGTAGR